MSSNTPLGKIRVLIFFASVTSLSNVGWLQNLDLKMRNIVRIALRARQSVFDVRAVVVELKKWARDSQHCSGCVKMSRLPCTHFGRR